MRNLSQKEIFSIRKLKIGVSSVILGIALLGNSTVFADGIEEIAVDSIPEIMTQVWNSEGKGEILDTGINAEQSTLVSPSLNISDVEMESPLIEKYMDQSLSVIDTEPLIPISDRKIEVPLIEEVTMSPLNVKDFGAVGDGLTDDRLAIQNTIDAAAKDAGLRKVYFPAGTYLVEEIVVLKSNTHIELHDNATILNGINQKNHPSIVFMTGIFTDDGDQVEWEPTKNISFVGGTIDMNGELNEDGTKAKNLPLINSSGAFAISNSSDFTIRNVTFKDSYQGHAIQIAGSNNVLIDNSRFIGQALPKTMKDSQIISKESIQIEPMTRKGFPYALNDTGKKSDNIIIQNSYFGKSEKTGELVTAIGTHYQSIKTENPTNIKILNNHFDNMMYAGVRFTGFTDVLIEGNIFDKRSREQSVHYRDGGATLVNAYSYKNTSDVLDLNKNIVIKNNRFNIYDPKTKAIRAARDKAEYLGKVTDIAVIKNIINNQSLDSNVPNIQMTRISNNLDISENVINGGYQGILIENSSGMITVGSNEVKNLLNSSVSIVESGNNENISVSTLNGGNLNISTVDGHYNFSAQSNDSKTYIATYSDPKLTDQIDKLGVYTVAIDQAESLVKYLSFKSSSKLSLNGTLTKVYDGQQVNVEPSQILISGSGGKLEYKYFTDENLNQEIGAPTQIGKYWLKIAVEEDAEYAGVSIVIPFEILELPIEKTEKIDSKQLNVNKYQRKKLHFQGESQLQYQNNLEREIGTVKDSPIAVHLSESKNNNLPNTGEVRSQMLSIVSVGALCVAYSLIRKKE